MKWFIKCLRQYTDFSGRARRQEYWMFMLFNVIFYVIWMLAANFVLLWIKGDPYNDAIRINSAFLSTGLCYNIALLLPNLAVMVRRLHDAGKSAWMLLATLIPIAGVIWLFVLTLIDGQREDNQYGPDPKTLPQPFATNAMDKNVSGGAILLVAAAAVTLLKDVIIYEWIFVRRFASFSDFLSHPTILMELVWSSVGPLAWLPLLVAAICLLRRQMKSAFILLLAAASIRFVLCSIDIWQYSKLTTRIIAADWAASGGFWPNFTDTVFAAAFWLLLAMFATFALWSKAVARKAAMVIIIIAVPWLLLWVYLNMEITYDQFRHMTIIFVLPSVLVDYILQMLSILFPIASIVLAVEFLAGAKALRVG